ncbi:MAG: zinc ribbon domain-containing protein [Spartobacteria bacterium]
MKRERPRSTPAPDVCPVCGEEVPRSAVACPECGADHNSGWREEAESDEVALPEEDFDYDEFIAKEFGSSPKPAAIRMVWWITAIIVLTAVLVAWLLAR